MVMDKRIVHVFAQLVILLYALGAGSVVSGQSPYFDSDATGAAVGRYVNEGRFEAARLENDNFLLEFQKTGVQRYKAYYYFYRGLIEYRTGECAAAALTMDSSAALLQLDNDRVLLGRLYHNLALSYACLYDHDQAFAFAQRSLEIFKGLGDMPRTIHATNTVSQIYQKLGVLDSAYIMAHNCRSLSLQNNLDYIAAQSDLTLGLVLSLMGYQDSAIVYLEESLDILDTIPDTRQMAAALKQLGYCHFTNGDYLSAADAQSRAIPLFHEQQWLENQCLSQINLAESYTQIGYLSGAQRWIDSTITLLSVPDTNPAVWQMLYAAKAGLLDAIGDSVQAAFHLAESIRFGDTIRAYRSYNLDKVIEDDYHLKDRQAEEAAVLASLHITKSILLWIQLIGFTTIGLLGSYTIQRLAQLLKSQKERNSIKRKLQDLQAKALSGSFQIATQTADGNAQVLNKDTLQRMLGGKLNDTDWSLLLVLLEDPNASNKILAERISISHEGVRSSLKKMYRLFQIEEKVTNKKMALIIKATTACVK